MTNVLIVGINKYTYKLIQLLLQMEQVKIVAIVSNKISEDVDTLAHSVQIKVVHHVNELYGKKVDYIFLMEKNDELLLDLQQTFKDVQIVQNDFISSFHDAISSLYRKLENQNNEIMNLQLI